MSKLEQSGALQPAQLTHKREKLPGSGMSPCAACKLLRRRCAKECVFAPYFPPDEPQKFANVHKVFGASNVNKMLQDLPVHQRSDAVGSMVYEADSRVRDPVYGCVGLISALQQQVASLQQQLATAQAEIVCLRMHQAAVASNVVSLKGLGMGVGLGSVGSSGGSSTMGASHSSITSHSSMGTSHQSPHQSHQSPAHHSHHSHQSPHHSHQSPHHSRQSPYHSHQSPHQSPPMQPHSPELHHQYKPTAMLMGMDTLDIGQAMWA